MIKYLNKDQVLLVNFNTCKIHGGLYTAPTNIKHEGKGILKERFIQI